MTDLEMEFRADQSAPRLSRSRIDGIGPDLGERLLDVKLIVSELVTNSVRHSNNSQKVRVKVRVDGERIRLEVIDEGPGFPPDPAKSDGLGLAIVERLADDWGVHVDEACTVWVEMSRSARKEVG